MSSLSVNNEMKEVSFIMKYAKKILVTGATSGIGLLLVQRLNQEGHEVWATGRNKEVLEKLQEQGIQTIQADLTSVESYEQLFGRVGVPDTVVLNAGIGTFAYLTELPDSKIDDMLQINVSAPIKLSKYFAEKMKEKGRGHLVFIASQAGKVATPKASVYAATKHAILGFANAARMELKEHGIFVSTINPGPIDTPFLDLADQTSTYRNKMKSVLLQPEKVVRAIVKVIEKPKREVDIPFYMSITSRLYAVMPKTVETLGKSFFTKK